MRNKKQLEIRIGILGSTGYIGRSLLAEGLSRGFAVVPFSRDQARAKEIFSRYGISPKEEIRTYSELGSEKFDVIINASGIGSPSEYQKNPSAVFEATESMDALLLSYLQSEGNEGVRVFNISSGSVYGLSAAGGVTDATEARFKINALSSSDYYTLAKLSSEAKHRAHAQYSIIDLRVFSFFSAYVSLTESFFLSQVMDALERKEELVTKGDSMVRDCMTTEDLLEAIMFLVGREAQNEVFDLVTRAPFEKFELLTLLEEKYSLAWRTDDIGIQSTTGEKPVYASQSDKLARLGFTSKYTSTEGIAHEMEKYFAR